MRDESKPADADVDLFSDPAYLIERQYKNSANLAARLGFHGRFSTNQEPWHRWAFDRIRLREGERLLEVGCGAGDLWAKNFERLPAVGLTLTDLSPGMLRDARSSIQIGAPSYDVADVQSLPFRSAVFDVAIANHMLYHVPKREQAISELWRVLRSGGRLVAATNGRSHLRELDSLMEGFLGSKRGHDDAEKFGLETGVEQIEEHFSRVECVRYEDRLLVTETEPLIRYILSIEETADEGAVERLRQHIDHEIASNGHIAISKDAGVLIAFT